VEHGGEPVDGRPQSFVGGQFFRQGPGHRPEEEVEELLGVGPEETAAQWLRQGEGDQEVGSLDQLGQFALDPAGGGGPAALRTGLVIARMPGEMNLAAAVRGRASKGPPAQGRGAAMVDGPKGAALFGREGRSGLQKLRQELTQRLQNGGGHETAES